MTSDSYRSSVEDVDSLDVTWQERKATDEGNPIEGTLIRSPGAAEGDAEGV